ncbi:MAG: hypothetical protein LBM13_03690 [Candidatus Ancillula sp.]|jgi:AraC-like DNA-binding protein|nr:hypothetical protein [Candidatus Ancillula sp.]
MQTTKQVINFLKHQTHKTSKELADDFGVNPSQLTRILNEGRKSNFSSVSEWVETQGYRLKIVNQPENEDHKGANKE